MTKNLLHRVIWKFRPWKCCVHVKETWLEYRRKEITEWLNKNAHSGWESLGYVTPNDDELEYRNWPHPNANGEYRTYPVPNAFVGIAFKNETEAIIFKMILNDL